MPVLAANRPAICPVCGRSNRCTQANPATATQACWCDGITIDTQTLAQAPAVLNRDACLCPACAQATQHAVDSNAS